MWNPFCRHAWKILSSNTFYNVPEELFNRANEIKQAQLIQCVLTVITVCDKCGAIKQFTEKTGG